MTLSPETRIGIAVFLAAVILVGGVIFLKGIDFRSRDYRLTIHYANVNGLTEGSPITIAGLTIGKVEDMRLAGNTIAVGVAIDNDVYIAKDSKAYIKSSSIMGGKQIAITPGMSDETLKNGDTLSGAYEADLTELTSTLSPISTNVLGILERVNTTFDEKTRRHIQNILMDLNRSTTELQSVIRTQGQTVDYAFDNFAEFSEQLTRVAKNLDTIAVSQRGNIDDGVKSIKVTAKTMEEAAWRFREASATLENVFKRIEKGEGTLGRLSRDEQLYRDVDSLVVNLNELVKDLKANPKRYVSVSVF
ncbi:MAG: MCE family protein [Bacteroidetes bacterium]|nr:MAG: MCE family protein [Bacteroidota bacterium]